MAKAKLSSTKNSKKDIELIQSKFESEGYICNNQIATAIFLSQNLNKPILVEGPPGVGKTELAKATAGWMNKSLIRLQCYEGLDEAKALYEWKYGKQLLYTQVLKDKLNVDVFGYINQIGIHKINSFDKDIINHNSFFCPDKSLVTTLEKYIDELREEGDSIGASISVEASNMPLGLGEPVFDKLDADIAHALMSINAVKAVEIGNGIEVVGLKGSVNRDEISPDGFESNNSGGISGGISTGQNLLAKVALKPTSSILVKGKSVNKEGESVEVVSKGRHDPCVGIRAVPIVEAMTAIVLIDHYLRNRAQNQDKPKEFNKIPSEKD